LEATQLNQKEETCVRLQLESILASAAFKNSPRAQGYLRFIVERALSGQQESLRERIIGVELYGRAIDYDTSNDGIVRVEASKIRKRLSQYYQDLTEPPEVYIELPVGSYIPVFRHREQHEAPPGAEAAMQPSSPAARLQQTAPQEMRFPRLLSWKMLVPILLVGVGILIGLGLQHVRPAARSIRTIAVLPLVDLSNAADQQLFADSMTAELISDLGQISALHVISRTSSMTFRGSQEKLPEIARRLGANAILEGSVVRTNNQLRVTTDLVDASTDQPLWSHNYVRNIDNTGNVESDIAQSIADEIKIALTPDERLRIRRPSTQVPAARQYLAQASAYSDIYDPANALIYYQKAVDADPNCATAWAGLANQYGWLGESGKIPYAKAFSMAQDSALKAVSIDGNLAEAHASLAMLAMVKNWDWTTAQQEILRARELNSSLAEVRWANAFLLIRLGRPEEAISEARVALQLDPVTANSHNNAAFIYYFAHRYDEALEQVQQAATLHHLPTALAFVLGDIYTEKGLYKEAIGQFQQMGDVVHATGHLGNAYARMGDTAAARQTITRIEAYAAQHGEGDYEVALVYAGLGEKDQAFAWLDKAYRMRDKGLTYLKIDPCMDPLRSDPRFNDLLHRVGFPAR
jgi:TolB-like protein/Tfp pilus assembly protein PilF